MIFFKDENALVVGAKKMGVIFHTRQPDKLIINFVIIKEYKKNTKKSEFVKN